MSVQDTIHELDLAIYHLRRLGKDLKKHLRDLDEAGMYVDDKYTTDLLATLAGITDNTHEYAKRETTFSGLLNDAKTYYSEMCEMLNEEDNE